MTTEEKDSRNRRRWMVRCLYPVYFLLFVLVSVEMGARVLLDDVDSAATVLEKAFPRLLNSAVTGGVDSPLGVRLTPNQERTMHWGELTHTVRTNSLGFRGREPAPRVVGEYRILFLGDSMVFGHGLEEEQTLPSQVETLGRETDPGVVVYNGAVSGMNTVQELAVAMQLLPVLQPDQVVLGYFVGNDPLANTFCDVDENGRVTFSVEGGGRLRDELEEHLRPLLRSVAFRAIALRYYVPRLRYEWSGRQEVLDRSLELLLRLSDQCERAGAGFAVLVIYPRDGVAGGLRPVLSGSRRIGEQLLERLREVGIPVVDGGDILGGGQGGGPFYFPNDGHLDSEGARVLATAAADELLKPGRAGGRHRLELEK